MASNTASKEVTISQHKESEKSVGSCSTENSAPASSQMRYQSRSMDELTSELPDDNRVTVGVPGGAYNASQYPPRNAAKVASSETFSLLDDGFSADANYKELSDRRPMAFMPPPQLQWSDYHTLTPEVLESDTTSTIGLEQAAGVECIGIEQLKLQSGIFDSDVQSIEVEYWTPLLQSHCEGVYVFGNSRLVIARDQSLEQRNDQGMIEHMKDAAYPGDE